MGVLCENLTGIKKYREGRGSVQNILKYLFFYFELLIRICKNIVYYSIF